MELFDRKYLHCMWSEEIDGKECLLCDDLSDLIKDVNNGNNLDIDIGHVIVRRQIKRSDGVRIADVNNISWIYAYYDPNYNVKVAYNAGMTVQVLLSDGRWEDIPHPRWCDNDKYRVKPKEPKRMTYRQLAEGLAKGNRQYRFSLTKDEAINLIENSKDELFEVKPIKYKTCELCKKPVKYGLEFKIESKHISCVDGLKSRPYVLKNTGKSSHLVKHICSDCYAKLFPEDVIKVEKEE